MMEKIKQSAIASYAVIILMYVVATLAALFVFSFNQGGHDILFIFLADLVATIVIWIFGVWFSNSSIYDPYWSVAPPIILTLLFFYYGIASTPAILLLIAIWFWAIRLTVNWMYTFPNLTHQDWRYTQYREESPNMLQWQIINFMGIHFIPTLVVFLAMVPAFFTLRVEAEANIFTYLSFALCIVAAILQLVSDIQMHQFRKNNKGKVCDSGLWKYSRHPNYLGEILLWWGIYFILISIAPQYWWTIFGPLANNLLFVFISIPLMEKRQLKNKPELYADYVKVTGRLLPQRR
ncbi:DUF1295 domain-containing protein [Bacteroidales bacterium OttesenSCG-928-B11]|nr:DUF1295 domain-containing protein [Bacteroidales bacterium OttesenSCG-928-E04]MDL2307983.1 DUF1295 domain-containing protein [Bacteroidales bacterium OttesenSCG-928-C03]MDL2311656.1 DUF1295 domain-containing protein [Bacteroidales bacterium OttesenSCG-928-B11]